MEKKIVRKLAKQKIETIGNKEKKSEKICEKLDQILGKTQKIIVYSADHWEVDLKFLFFNSPHRSYYFPKVFSESEKRLEFILPYSWETGKYGISEPIGEEKISPEEAEFSIIPALGWNRFGYRLGRGGGYYDRNFFQISPKKLIGLSFAEAFPMEFEEKKHDLQAGLILSELEGIFSGLDADNSDTKKKD